MDSNRPMGVRTSPPDASFVLMAPSLKSLSIAYSTVSSDGGSMALDKKCCTPVLVIEHVCKQVASSAVRWISGVGRSAMACRVP